MQFHVLCLFARTSVHEFILLLFKMISLHDNTTSLMRIHVAHKDVYRSLFHLPQYKLRYQVSLFRRTYRAFQCLGGTKSLVCTNEF